MTGATDVPVTRTVGQAKCMTRTATGEQQPSPMIQRRRFVMAVAAGSGAVFNQNRRKLRAYTIPGRGGGEKREINSPVENGPDLPQTRPSRTSAWIHWGLGWCSPSPSVCTAGLCGLSSGTSVAAYNTRSVTVEAEAPSIWPGVSPKSPGFAPGETRDGRCPSAFPQAGLVDVAHSPRLTVIMSFWVPRLAGKL